MEIEEIKDLKKRAEGLKMKLAKAEAQKERAESDLNDVISEIKKKAKCEPSELAAKIKKLEKEIDKEAEAIKQKLEDAEGMRGDAGPMGGTEESGDEGSGSEDDPFGDI